MKPNTTNKLNIVIGNEMTPKSDNGNTIKNIIKNIIPNGSKNKRAFIR